MAHDSDLWGLASNCIHTQIQYLLSVNEMFVLISPDSKFDIRKISEIIRRFRECIFLKLGLKCLMNKITSNCFLIFWFKVWMILSILCSHICEADTNNIDTHYELDLSGINMFNWNHNFSTLKLYIMLWWYHRVVYRTIFGYSINSIIRMIWM